MELLSRLGSAVQQGPVAQLVEHRTFNAVVAGSSPARLTISQKRELPDTSDPGDAMVT